MLFCCYSRHARSGDIIEHHFIYSIFNTFCLRRANAILHALYLNDFASDYSTLLLYITREPKTGWPE